jgi:putative membrane-bound dehydrogenase-like protein
VRNPLILIALSLALLLPVGAFAQPDLGADGNALPKAPAGFEVKFFAKEPLVRQPCSMAFDARGRLFVGMGPQYRMPKPDTPGDSIVIVEDTDGDGVADKVKVFATGFNCIQSLAWHGRDLWVANSPDLTIVRDLDGDDEADEYIRVYTDLGNLEHALHGLNWAPDGKLYMSKGNSKGYSDPKKASGPTPRAFMELAHGKVHPDWPAFPEPVKFTKQNYKKNYHTPPDDQGREGGVLRCDDGGKNLEIVSRGMRNPWDITLDDGFNWLGTDNDANEGDRIFMPFWNAHFGWNHPWSAHWNDKPHPPSAPVSGPMFEGSGTGIIFCDSPQFPPEYRKVFFINDWLRKTTFAWKPTWDGAFLKPEGGTWKPFIEGGKSLFRPTDIEVGPDGALWVLGWSRYYGAEPPSAYTDGKMINEGRIFHIRWKDAKPRNGLSAKRKQPLSKWSVAELIEDFEGPLPVWRIDAADELVRRGDAVKADLIASLRGGKLSTMQETWTAWTLGRMLPDDAAIEKYFTSLLEPDSTASLNLRIQAVRILAHRIRQHQMVQALPPAVSKLLHSDEPRLRFACVDAIAQAKQTAFIHALVDRLATETDRVVYYAGWQGMRELLTLPELKGLLADKRAGVRKAALLALLETHALTVSEIGKLADGDPDGEVGRLATLRLRGNKSALGSSPTSSKATTGAPSSGIGVSLVANVKAESRNHYRSVPGGVREGGQVYTDRQYAIQEFPPSLALAELLQTSQEDDGSRGDKFLTFDALVPLRMHIGLDSRIPVPKWLSERFRPTEQKIVSANTTYRLFTREIPDKGRVELGGNTEKGGSGISNYMVVLEPLPLPQLGQPTTLAQGLEQLSKGDVRRGELYFKQVAGCAKCHSLSQQKNSFGPQLADIGARAEPRHIVQSIVEPDAHIVEGFSQLVIETKDGKVHSGVLVEESGLAVTLGLPTAERLVIPREKIESRTTSKKSAMPSFDRQLTPSQVADIAAFLLTQRAKPAELQKPKTTSEATKPVAPPSKAKKSEPEAVKPSVDAKSQFGLDLKRDRLIMTYAEKPLGEYVWEEPKILRPFFANLHGSTGTKITRNHPPIPGKDSTDHDTMHPGIWLAFGQISGVDFWRNQGRIQHVKFLASPTATEDRISFATESELLKPDGKRMGGMVNRYTVSRRPAGWLLVWDATMTATEQDLVFGDQEEMGFGARIASDCTESKGGTLLNSHGVKSARVTWGKPAAWCDYSGTKDGQRIGITLMPGPKNFRESWWHNRDYGVFVANAFGREAMKQGVKSAVEVKKGESLRLVYGAMLHDGKDYDPASEYKHFVEDIK